MNQENMHQGSENTAVMPKQEFAEKKGFVCPIDPAELAQCDSCQ